MRTISVNRVMPVVLLALAPLGLLLAQDGPARNAKSAASASQAQDAKPPMAVTPEREAAVMTFVERNHPALKDVLASLKISRPKEYEKAIRDIYQTSERLANIKERDPHLYDLELSNWTVRSQIQLLTARMVMASSEEIRKELRRLLNEQMEVRAKILRLDRERAQKRLSSIDEELAKLDADREQRIEKQLDLLMRSANASKPKNKITGKGGQSRPGVKNNQPTVNEPAKNKTNPSNSP